VAEERLHQLRNPDSGTEKRKDGDIRECVIEVLRAYCQLQEEKERTLAVYC
jgi:hypothetical protein